jgi:flagellar motor protein MotB
MPLALLLALNVSADSGPEGRESTRGVGLGLGVDVAGGIGKTRDRTFVQPWNLTASAQAACKLRLFDDYGLVLRAGYGFFKDEPVVITWIPEESLTSELKVHELCVSIGQLVRPVPFLWLEQGLALAFPVKTKRILYSSHLTSDGWSDYERISSERLDRSFYYSYPLAALTYGVGFDMSRILPRNVPVSVFFRREFGLVPMYLGTDFFAATGREQVRLSWGLRGTLVELGRPTPAPAPSPGEKKHALECAVTLGGGLGNLQSMREDSRFHLEEMAWGSIRAAYVYDSRFRLALELSDQLRQYTESEFNRDPGDWQTGDFREDYFRHYLNYLGTSFWLEVMPIRYVVSGVGIGLWWLLPFGDYGWRYVESGSTGAMTKQRVYHPHEYYDRSFDPSLLLKCGAPLSRWTELPLELDVVFQLGWRTVDISTGFYRERRPTYAAVSVALSYVFEPSSLGKRRKDMWAEPAPEPPSALPEEPPPPPPPPEEPPEPEEPPQVEEEVGLAVLRELEGVEVEEEEEYVRITAQELALHFESGSVELPVESIRILRGIADFLKSYPGRPVRIEGHTDADPLGGRLRRKYPDNQALSQARADKVKKYFIAVENLPEGLFTSVGLGSSQPVVPNDTVANKRRNRRFVIEIRK